MDNQNKIEISDVFLEKISFNFSFISKNYSVDYKNLNSKIARSVLEKLKESSKYGYEMLLRQNYVETLKPEEIRESMMAISADFYTSGRYDKCSSNYVIIKGGKFRIIGKVNPKSNIYYALAIDTDFELYDHGDHKGNNR